MLYISDSWFVPMGVCVPQGYKAGHLGVCKKKIAEKGTYINSVRQDTSQKL